MGIIYTAGLWYLADDRLDISINSKSAFGVVFAPSADLERMPRADEPAWEAYQVAYRERIKHVYRHNTITFNKLLDKPEVTLVCSCVDPNRCHRSLLAGYLGLSDPKRTDVRDERPRLALVPGPVPADLRPELGRCFAEGCKMSVPFAKLTCHEHWKLIPKPIQDTLRATFRKGQERDLAVASEAYMQAAREARAGIKPAEVKLQRGMKAGAAQ